MRGEEQFEKLLEHIPLEGFETDPEQPRALYISNYIRRVFVTLFAKYGDDLTRLAATVDGELTVSDSDALEALAILAGYLDGVETLITATNALLTTQAGYLDGVETALAATLTVSADAQIPDKYYAFTDTAADGYTVATAFGFISKTVSVFTSDHPLTLRLKLGAEAEGPLIRIPADTGISLALKASSYRIRNGTGGSNAIYSIVATGLA